MISNDVFIEAGLSAKEVISLNDSREPFKLSTSTQARLRAEFKHITKRRKRN
jgi:hypothetical protein